MFQVWNSRRVLVALTDFTGPYDGIMANLEELEDPVASFGHYTKELDNFMAKFEEEVKAYIIKAESARYALEARTSTLNPSLHHQVIKARDLLHKHITTHVKKNAAMTAELEKLVNLSIEPVQGRFNSQLEFQEANHKLQSASESIKALAMWVEGSRMTMSSAISEANSLTQNTMGFTDDINYRDVLEEVSKGFLEFKNYSKLLVSKTLQDFSYKNLYGWKNNDSSKQITQSLLAKLSNSKPPETRNESALSDKNIQITNDKIEDLEKVLQDLGNSSDLLETEVSRLQNITQECEVTVREALQDYYTKENKKLVEDISRQIAKFENLKLELESTPIKSATESLSKKVEKMRRNIESCEDEITRLTEQKNLTEESAHIKAFAKSILKPELALIEKSIDQQNKKYSKEVEKYQLQVQNLTSVYNQLKSSISSTSNDSKKLLSKYTKLDNIILEKLKGISQDSETIEEKVDFFRDLRSKGAQAYTKDKEIVENQITEMEAAIAKTHEKFREIEQAVQSQILAQGKTENGINLLHDSLVKKLQEQLSVEDFWKTQMKIRYDSFSSKLEGFENDFRGKEKEAIIDKARNYLVAIARDLERFETKQNALSHLFESMEIPRTTLSINSSASFTLMQDEIEFNVMDIIDEKIREAQENVFANSAILAAEQEQVLQKLNILCDSFELQATARDVETREDEILKYMSVFSQIEEKCDDTLRQVSLTVGSGEGMKKFLDSELLKHNLERKPASDVDNLDVAAANAAIKKFRDDMEAMTFSLHSMESRMGQILYEFDIISNGRAIMESKMAELEQQISACKSTDSTTTPTTELEDEEDELTSDESSHALGDEEENEENDNIGRLERKSKADLSSELMDGIPGLFEGDVGSANVNTDFHLAAPNDVSPLNESRPTSASAMDSSGDCSHAEHTDEGFPVRPPSNTLSSPESNQGLPLVSCHSVPPPEPQQGENRTGASTPTEDSEAEIPILMDDDERDSVSMSAESVTRENDAGLQEDSTSTAPNSDTDEAPRSPSFSFFHNRSVRSSLQTGLEALWRLPGPIGAVNFESPANDSTVQGDEHNSRNADDVE